MKRLIVKVLLVLMILLLLNFSALYFLQGFAIPSGDEHEKFYKSFYSEEKNSLDGIYMGASSATRYWIPPLAFHESGAAIGSMATTSQPFVILPYLMQEAKKTQDPDVFIIELRCVFKDPSYVKEEYIRDVTDNMKPSLLRLKAVRAALDYMALGENDVDGNELSVYFPALETLKRKLKGQLVADTEVTFLKNAPESPSKGFLLTASTFTQAEVPKSEYNTTKKEVLYPASYEALIDLLDYCDSIDNEVLFVLSPYSANENSFPRINTAIEIVESRGYDVLNLNTKTKLAELGVDWETDYYNKKHVNIIGAERYTRYLTEYVDEHYSLGDHRDDPAYSDWHESYDYYTEFVEHYIGRMKY